jgi:hypothetical protein
MLYDRMKIYIIEEIRKQSDGVKEIHLHKEEKEYAERHQLLPNELSDLSLIEKNAEKRFNDANIERCDKETETIIAEESSKFLNQPITYLKEHTNEFIYLESAWFDLVAADAISLEWDDVFGRYGVLLGLKLQKKFQSEIKKYLANELNGEEAPFEILFSDADGLWDLNFTLNYLKGYTEQSTIGDAYSLIYSFLFQLAESIETNK